MLTNFQPTDFTQEDFCEPIPNKAKKEKWRALECIVCKGSACRRQVLLHHYLSNKSPTKASVPLCYWCFKGLEHCGRLNIVKIKINDIWMPDFVNPLKIMNTDESDKKSENDIKNGLKVMAFVYERNGKINDDMTTVSISSTIKVCISDFVIYSVRAISIEGTSRLSRLLPEIVEEICSYL